MPQAKAASKAKARAKAQGPEPQSADVDNEKPCPKMEMVVVSPLATSFNPTEDRIQPFWAVSRLSRASHLESNMERVKYVVQVPYPTTSDSNSGLKVPPNLPKLFATSAYLRNTKKVANGDVLTLPYEADCEKVVQSDRP